MNNPGKDLRQLYASHAGKLSDRWTSYLERYESLLADWRLRPVRLLEIGVQNGGSLELWAQYFPHAALIAGCDIEPQCGDLRYDDPRVKVVVGDISEPATEQKIDALSPQWDIIIDDGSHQSGHIVAAFARYFPKLMLGGLFVAEDLHCSYWGEYEGGLSDPFSSVAFFKCLLDVIHYEHWGVVTTRAQYLQRFARRYRCRFDDSVLAQIHAVEFHNSQCVIRKHGASQNVLGARVAAGTTATVSSKVLALAGTSSRPPDQSQNPWSDARHFDFPHPADPKRPRQNPLIAALAWRFNKARRLVRDFFRTRA